MEGSYNVNVKFRNNSHHVISLAYNGSTYRNETEVRLSNTCSGRRDNWFEERSL